MKKMVVGIITAIVVILIGYITLTPIGALRFGVLKAGHPISAITLKVLDEPNRFFTEENQIGYSLENPPVEKATDSELVNWVVTKYGIFYTAHYYGWG